MTVFGRFHGYADTGLLVVKSAVAATVSWWIAAELLQAQAASFAPFSALLMVYMTVSRSVHHSVRYVVAMVGGILLAGALTTLLGEGLVTFPLIVLVALVIGQWRRLGSHGWQVAVAVMFAYQYFAQATDWRASWVQLGVLCGLVVLGAVIGVVTNLVLVPPLRYQPAEDNVRSLSRSVTDCLAEFADAVNEGLPPRDRAQNLWERTQELSRLATQARLSVDDAAESQQYNPRRLLARAPSFSGHYFTVNALARVVNDLQSVARALDTDDEADAASQQRWLASYGELLSSVAEVCRLLGEVHSAADLGEDGELAERLDQAQRCCQELGNRLEREGLDSPDRWPTFQSLSTDAHRLVDDLASARDELAQLN
ncbi:FUSC family protein [Saccharopolyspora cebuensis]|uniref:Aromatic acid exporter family protein n=1 Tax=Saccharopolyspora cebuensis TaxID=418759 RepID=A0ABV4CUZ9_9PSEU